MTAKAKRQGCLLRGHEKGLCPKWENWRGGRLAIYLDDVQFHLKRLWPGLPNTVWVEVKELIHSVRKLLKDHLKPVSQS